MIPFAGHHRRRDQRLPPDTTLYLLLIILLVLAVIIAALLWGGGDRGPAPAERPGAAEMAPQEPAGCNPLADPACAMADLQGLRVAPEHRCTPYNRDDYRYSQSVEDQIIAGLGGVYGPYTGRWFRSKYDTDIEHMVAVSEAHDSGLCAADGRTRMAFAGDPLNLTLASGHANEASASGGMGTAHVQGGTGGACVAA